MKESEAWLLVAERIDNGEDNFLCDAVKYIDVDVLLQGKMLHRIRAAGLFYEYHGVTTAYEWGETKTLIEQRPYRVLAAIWFSLESEEEGN